MINANDQNVEIAHWYVEEGAWIEKGQDLVDLGTSKATFTVQSEGSGFVKWLFSKGELAVVGAPFAVIFESLEETASSEIAESGKKPMPQMPTGFTRFSNGARKYIEGHAIDPAK